MTLCRATRVQWITRRRRNGGRCRGSTPGGRRGIPRPRPPHYRPGPAGPRPRAGRAAGRSASPGRERLRRRCRGRGRRRSGAPPPPSRTSPRHRQTPSEPPPRGRSGQHRGRRPGGGTAGYIQDRGAEPATQGDVGEHRVDRVAEGSAVQRGAPRPVDDRAVDRLLHGADPAGRGTAAQGPGEALREGKLVAGKSVHGGSRYAAGWGVYRAGRPRPRGTPASPGRGIPAARW